VVAGGAAESVQAGWQSGAACHRGGEADQAAVTQQIGGWLKLTYPTHPEMQVSHESIYRTLFVQSCGALRKELTGICAPAG
jgi:hypothetical protein